MSEFVVRVTDKRGRLWWVTPKDAHGNQRVGRKNAELFSDEYEALEASEKLSNTAFGKRCVKFEIVQVVQVE